MIRAWLDLPAPGIFAVLIILYFGSSLVLSLIAFRSRLTKPIMSLTGVVAPFFGSVAILFALLTGFLANDVSERNRRAHRAVEAEAGEIHNLHTLSVASASDMQSIRKAIKVYVASVVTDEWPAMDKGQTSPLTGTAYDDLLREVSNPSIAKASGPAVHSALLADALRIGSSRNERVAISTDHTNDLKWLVVILLALFTQVAIALVHLERPRAFAASMIVFSSAVVVALGIIALQEYPFNGAFSVSPAPIAQLLSLPEAVPPHPLN
ncbi:hypothetical protein BH10PSE10_BH10PSE10_14640 [soil metagenome]